MRKIVLIGALVVIVVAAIAGGLFWYFMGEPLYRPGLVATADNLRAPLDPPQQDADPEYWQVEPDIRLFHFAAGEGQPVLVVHGGPGTPFSQTLPGLDPLTDSHRFVYYHQRGCGKSTRPIDRFDSPNFFDNMTNLDSTLGIGAQIADLERIRRLLGQEQLTLLGHSYGAFLASMYAAEFPQRTRALILVCPAHLLVMPMKGGGLFEKVREYLPAESQQEFSAFMNEYLDFGTIFEKSDEQLADLQQRFAKYYAVAAEAKGFQLPALGNPEDAGGWMVWAQYLGLGQRHDYRAALQAVDSPVLIIHGERDLQSLSESQTYEKAFANARFEIIPAAGHFPFADQPEIFSKVVGDFLGNLP